MAHHTVNTPPTALSTENLDKPAYNPGSLSVPRSPLMANHNINVQKPEFFNRIEENREGPRTEKVLPEERLEENLDRSHQFDATTHTDAEDTIMEENVKVTETISHEIVEKNLNIANKELETTPLQKIDKPDEEHTNAIEKQPESTNSLKEDTSKSQAPTVGKKTGNNQADDSNVIHQSAFSGEGDDVYSSANGGGIAEKSNGVTAKNATTDENKVTGNVLNGSRHKQQALFSTSRTEVARRRRRHSLNAHSRNTLVETPSVETKTYVNLRFKPRSTKVSVTGNTVEEGVRNSTSKTTGSAIATKRRHSAISQSVINTVEEACILQEPCIKRRTRSEDRPNPVDENDPANQTTKDAAGSLNWPNAESNISRSPGNAAAVTIQDRLSPLNTFQRNLGKKVTPVKSIRRPSSIKGLLKQLWAASLGAREWDQGRNNRSNGCNERRISRTMSIIGSSDNTTVPQRWLRYLSTRINNVDSTCEGNSSLR